LTKQFSFSEYMEELFLQLEDHVASGSKPVLCDVEPPTLASQGPEYYLEEMKEGNQSSSSSPPPTLYAVYRN